MQHESLFIRLQTRPHSVRKKKLSPKLKMHYLTVLASLFPLSSLAFGARSPSIATIPFGASRYRFRRFGLTGLREG